jgi:serine/threonine protein phosphatase PrpC
MPRIKGRIDYGSGVSKKSTDPDKTVNDDNFSSAILTLPDGQKMRLDAVWDGMGGYEGGAIASRIAKDIFEMAAVCGWVTSAEDVRRLLVMTDLAIVFEQLSDKYDLKDPQLLNTLTLGSHPQKNKMGTTAVVSLQQGEELFVVHCGDSDFKLIEQGRSAYRHIHHDSEYGNRMMILEYEAFQELTEDLRRMNADPQTLGHSAHSRLKQSARQLAEEKIRRELINQSPGSPISAVLGGHGKYMQINGLTYEHKPLRVKDDSIQVLCSDGISDIVCEHEYAMVINNAKGDLELARRNILALAEMPPADFLCGCGPRPEKNDDKTLIIRYAKDGF